MRKLFRQIILLIAYFIVLVVGGYSFGITIGKNKDRYIEKYKRYFMLMLQWKRIDDNELVNFLFERGIKRVAIYGMGDIGKLLSDILNNTKINVECFIESKKSDTYKGIPTIEIDDFDSPVDAIIVTPFLELKTIEDRIRKTNNCQVFSIEEVINGATK